MQTVAVIGLGTIGIGVAQTCAAHGFDTLVREKDATCLWEGLARIDRRLNALVQAGAMSRHTKQRLQERFIPAQGEHPALDRASLVIEAISDSVTAKIRLWHDLGPRVSPTTVLATSAPSRSVTAQASGITSPERLVGLHFFHPVSTMPLVEVIQGMVTAEATMEAACLFVRRIGKTPVRALDTPGRIV